MITVSGVTSGLSQDGQNVAEGGPLAKTKKNWKIVVNPDDVDVYTSQTS